MNRTIATTSPEASSFDDLARRLSEGLTRRRALGLLGASALGSALGAATLVDADAKGKKGKNDGGKGRKKSKVASERRKGKGKGGKGKGKGDTQTPATTTPAPIVPTTPAPPPPPALCLAAGNQCGSTAALQGTCRAAVAADNQAGFICTSNTAGNACTASTQCGPGTRCVVQGAAQTCRVVIP